jgi:predicted RNA-binding protein YlxR (DUF448 family)
VAARPRKQPQRSCIACRTRRDQRELIRFVRTAGAGDAPRVQVDERGRASGRGAYLCAEAACWASALDGDVLQRALRGPVTSEDRDTLRAFAERRFAPESVAEGVR